MRRSAGLGPAKPREIYDALRQGGYQFNAQEDETALVGMRALLRKMNSTFHKVPGTSAYGLRSWYPHAGDGEVVDCRCRRGGCSRRQQQNEREHDKAESEAASAA
jgi:hypothetical protein